MTKRRCRRPERGHYITINLSISAEAIAPYSELVVNAVSLKARFVCDMGTAAVGLSNARDRETRLTFQEPHFHFGYTVLEIALWR